MFPNVYDAFKILAKEWKDCTFKKLVELESF